MLGHGTPMHGVKEETVLNGESQVSKHTATV
jgi:hypothetical protein